MAKTSEIKVEVTVDEQQIPEKITWKAADSKADMDNNARAMMLSFWDPEDKAAFRIDLWTKKMMMDEMAEFMFQTFMGMADTYERATQYTDHAMEMKQFAQDFLKKFQSRQTPVSKADMK